MSSLNKVMIIGRLGRDPEMRYTQAGKPVCSLNVATDEGYTNDRGEKVDKTEWHKVVFWDRQAETCSQYLAKGSLVFVEGRLSTRKYQDQQGQDRYVTEIQGQRVQFLDRKADGDGQQGRQGGGRQTQRRTATGNRADREADARHKGGTPPTMKTSAPPSLPKPPASMTCLFRQNQ